VSVFSRGWNFFDDDRVVKLEPGGLFLFTKGDTVIRLRNNFQERGYWLYDEFGAKLDVEGAFEKFFAMELPSEVYLIKCIQDNFPEDLFKDETVSDSDEEEMEAE
jgi:hypothetical protein